MNSGYFVLLCICGAMLVGSAIVHFASAVVLQFYVDHERITDETGEPGWKIFGSISAPLEFYKPAARPLWYIRRVSWKILWVAFAATFVVMLLEAIATASRKP